MYACQVLAMVLVFAIIVYTLKVLGPMRLMVYAKGKRFSAFIFLLTDTSVACQNAWIRRHWVVACERASTCAVAVKSLAGGDGGAAGPVATTVSYCLIPA
jgi:hypothetical protein